MTEITVDKGEFDRRQSAWDLLDSMLKNPKTRAKTREAIKELKPDVSFPEDIADPLLKPLSERLESLEKGLREDKEKKTEQELREKIARLKKDHNFTDEGIDELIKLMKDKNVGDPEVAAIYIKSTQQKPVEIQGLQPTNWDIASGADENVKSLFADPDSWADREAAKVVMELRSGKTAA